MVVSLKIGFGVIGAGEKLSSPCNSSKSPGDLNWGSWVRA